jgi:hypothetical protein
MRAGHLQVVVISSWLLATVAAATTLNDGGVTKLNIGVRDTNVSFTTAVSDRFPTALPYADTHSLSQGAASSTDIYAFTESNFNIRVNHHRPGLIDSGAGTSSDVFFSVAAGAPYLLSGTYTAIEPDPRHVVIDVTFSDVDTHQVLFHNRQSSLSTPNESFVLGGSGGDSENEVSGSLSGSLLAGHRYHLEYHPQIYANFTGTESSASGFINLAIPEPGTIGLISLFAFGGLLRRNRSRIPLVC